MQLVQMIVLMTFKATIMLDIRLEYWIIPIDVHSTVTSISSEEIDLDTAILTSTKTSTVTHPALLDAKPIT